MHKIFFLLVFVIGVFQGAAQNDTVVYFGVNGRIATKDAGIIRKEIRHKNAALIEEITWKKNGNDWAKSGTAQIKVSRDGSMEIRHKDAEKNSMVTRRYEEAGNGIIRFSEVRNNQLVRKGLAINRLPLLLHGEVTEYYGNGKIRSRSQYNRNELISNENWLENGDKYIDSIFYNVHEEPAISGGSFILNQHVRQALTESGLDFSSVSGNLVLGFVVMENGKIDGIRVIQGLGEQINGIAVQALQTLNGKWKPARLSGRNVRYFQLLPINFIIKETNFQSLESDGHMIYYDKY